MKPILRITAIVATIIFCVYVFNLPRAAFSSDNNDGALGKYSKPVNKNYDKARKSIGSSSGSGKIKKKQKNNSSSSAGSFGDKINKAYRKATNQEK